MLQQKPGQCEFLRPLRTTHPSRERRLLQLFDRVTAGRPILSECGVAAGFPMGWFLPPEPEYMGFWIRAAAGLIDVAVIGAIGALMDIFHAPLSTYLLAYVAYPVYYVALTGLKGQTLGKMALGIMVVNAQGEVPGIRRAAFREIVGKFVSEIAIFLGYAWSAGTERSEDGTTT